MRLRVLTFMLGTSMARTKLLAGHFSLRFEFVCGEARKFCVYRLGSKEVLCLWVGSKEVWS